MVAPILPIDKMEGLSVVLAAGDAVVVTQPPAYDQVLGVCQTVVSIHDGLLFGAIQEVFL